MSNDDVHCPNCDAALGSQMHDGDYVCGACQHTSRGRLPAMPPAQQLAACHEAMKRLAKHRGKKNAGDAATNESRKAARILIVLGIAFVIGGVIGGPLISARDGISEGLQVAITVCVGGLLSFVAGVVLLSAANRERRLRATGARGCATILSHHALGDDNFALVLWIAVPDEKPYQLKRPKLNVGSHASSIVTREVVPVIVSRDDREQFVFDW